MAGELAGSNESLGLAIAVKYQELGADYARFLSSQITDVDSKGPLHLDEESQSSLQLLPNQAKVKLVEFSTNVCSFMPADFSSQKELYPTSSGHLRALVATAYNLQTQRTPETVDKEMYVRCIAALVDDNYIFQNEGHKNTNELIGDFIQDGYTKDRFFNFLIQLTKETMPIVGYYDSREIDQQRYNDFYERVGRQTKLNKAVLRKYAAKVFPGQQKPAAEDDYPLVYAGEIINTPIVTNDFDITKRASYMSTSSVSGVSWGVDSLTGLPIMINKLPDKWYEERDQTKPFIPGEDLAVTQSRTAIHEAIHTLSSSEQTADDWQAIILELLTESATEIIFLEANNQSFLNPGPEYMGNRSYRGLVDFTRDLARMELLSTDQIVKMGFKRDIQGFLRILDSQIGNLSDEQASQLVSGLVRNTLIKPLKKSEISDKAAEFKKNPVQFMRDEMLAMWRAVGEDYIGTPNWLGYIITDNLMKDQGYVENMKQLYTQYQPDTNYREKIWIDPRDSLFTDEAVDLFRKLVDVPHSPEKGADYYPSWFVNRLLSTRLNRLKIGTATLPKDLQLSGRRDADFIRKIVDRTNKVLAGHLDPHQRTSDKSVLDLTVKFYETVATVLVNNWRKENIDFTRDDIFYFFSDLIPRWFYNDGTFTNNPDLLVEKVKTMTSALTASFNPTGQRTIVPSKEWAFHYGHALKEDEDQKAHPSDSS